MSRKSQLKKEIEECEHEIRAYEQKRERSQNALFRAMLAGKKPSPEDERYFTVFSDLIDRCRERLRELNIELEKLENK